MRFPIKGGTPACQYSDDESTSARRRETIVDFPFHAMFVRGSGGPAEDVIRAFSIDRYPRARHRTTSGGRHCRFLRLTGSTLWPSKSAMLPNVMVRRAPICGYPPLLLRGCSGRSCHRGPRTAIYQISFKANWISRALPAVFRRPNVDDVALLSGSLQPPVVFVHPRLA